VRFTSWPVRRWSEERGRAGAEAAVTALAEVCPEPGSWLPNCFQTFLLYTWAKTSASPQCATFNSDYQWTARLSNLA
jgi:hypothetical protein